MERTMLKQILADSQLRVLKSDKIGIKLLFCLHIYMYIYVDMHISMYIYTHT